MITILHGDHEVKISNEVVRLIGLSQSQGQEVVRLLAKKLSLSDLETALGTEALFATHKTVILDGLFSLPKGKLKETLIATVKAHHSPEIHLILVEKKALTATQLKSLPEAKPELFKFPAVLFSWLEGLGRVPAARSIELYHQVLEREEEQFAFIMLIRQARLLLGFVCDGTYEGPPFLRAKLAAQARAFTPEKLLRLHTQLLILDEQQKTSRLSLPLAANLDLLLAVV